MRGSNVFFGSTAIVLVLVACATGGDPTTAEVVSPTTTGDAAAPGCGGACGAEELCSSGTCVPATTDADGDGFPVSTDCDNHNPTIHPGAVEVCNGKDDNCNGKIDEGFDVDGDGYFQCESQGKKADCDDNDPTVHPGAAEVCNGKDDDCDGVIDNGFDKDNDGYYVCAHGTIGADCDDDDPTVHPGAKEICNGKDDDCNGKIDDVPALVSGVIAPPSNPHWTALGTTQLLSTGWAELTPDTGGIAGSLWWNALYTFDTFDMTATFWIENVAGADGMAFAWVPGATMALGAAGEGFGVGALGGYAVAIDTFQDPGQPAVPYLTVVDETIAPYGTQILRQSLPNVRDSQNHTLRVKLDAGAVSAWVDGVNYINAFALPGYVPFAGHWGFGGGTGGANEEHFVENISMAFPNGQGCVP